MTVGSNVKSCYFSVKNAEATLKQLAIKTNVEEAEDAFLSAEAILSEVKNDLQKQVIFIKKEEPQYK